jgi:hypothetical protein
MSAVRLALRRPRRCTTGVIESPRWIDRYRAGRRAEVWHELRQTGATLRSHDQLLAEAQLVADEMARRARHNIEVIIKRLTNAGYEFHVNDRERTPAKPFVPATPEAADHARWLEQNFGPIPLTLLSWVRIVGDVWLVGTHPEWPESGSADPLVLEVEGSRELGGGAAGMQLSFLNERREWPESYIRQEDPEPFVLPLAPDRLVKDNVSGGGPYGVVVPDGCVDGLFVAETTMPFVSYLNNVFAHGGFPARTDTTGQWKATRELARDLLPL